MLHHICTLHSMCTGLVLSAILLTPPFTPGHTSLYCRHARDARSSSCPISLAEILAMPGKRQAQAAVRGAGGAGKRSAAKRSKPTLDEEDEEVTFLDSDDERRPPRGRGSTLRTDDEDEDADAQETAEEKRLRLGESGGACCCHICCSCIANPCCIHFAAQPRNTCPIYRQLWLRRRVEGQPAGGQHSEE